MSKPRNEPPRPAFSGPDGATVSKPMTLTGVVRTSKGFAVAIVTLSPDGAVLQSKVGLSQTHKEFVALEHKRPMTAAIQRA